MQNPKNLTQQKRKRIPSAYLSIPFLLNGPFFFLGCWSLRYWPTLPQAPLEDSGRYSWGWSIAIKSTCSSCFGFLQLLNSQTTKTNHWGPEALLTSGLFWGKYVGNFWNRFLIPLKVWETSFVGLALFTNFTEVGNDAFDRMVGNSSSIRGTRVLDSWARPMQKR